MLQMLTLSKEDVVNAYLSKKILRMLKSSLQKSNCDTMQQLIKKKKTWIKSWKRKGKADAYLSEEDVARLLDVLEYGEDSGEVGLEVPVHLQVLGVVRIAVRATVISTYAYIPCTLLDTFCRISLYLTDDAMVKLYVT